MRQVLQPNEYGIIQTRDVNMHSIRRRPYFIQRREVKIRTPSEDNCHFTNRKRPIYVPKMTVRQTLCLSPCSSTERGKGRRGFVVGKCAALFIFFRHTTIVGQTNQFTSSKGGGRRDKKLQQRVATLTLRINEVFYDRGSPLLF